jgi:TatD DNase family protein
MIDTHTHLTDEAFLGDIDRVLQRAIESGVTRVITVGTDVETSRQAVALAGQFDMVYAAVGIHPTEITSSKMQDPNNFQFSIFKSMNKLEKLLQEPKVVAIGEIGLDKHSRSDKPQATLRQAHGTASYKLQQDLFVEQVKMAHHYDKPVVLHSREVKQDVLDAIQEINLPVRGVFHCYEGSKKYLKRIMEAGFYVSFTGNITYSEDRLAVAAEVPLNRLLLETDSPLMTPLPYRGERNEPSRLGLIAEAHARIRGIAVEVVMAVTTENARKLFLLG